MARHHRRWLSTLSLPLLVVALLLSPLASGAGITPVASAQDKVPLTLWLFEGEEQLLPALEKAFEETHPDIGLQITLIPEDNYVVKIDTALAAGSPPDLGFLYDRRWVKSGKVLPLDELIADNTIDLTNFNPAIMEFRCTVDGTIYCLGSYTGAVVLIYNKAMFDAASLEYPSATEPMTIDEYAALAQQLTQPNDDLTQQIWGASAEGPFWWMNLNTSFSDDGHTTEGYINDDATKHTYEVLGNMVQQGYSPAASLMQSLGTDSMEDLFRQGKLGMVIGDFSQISALEEAGIDYGVATLPVEQEGDAPYLPVWTDGMAVFAGSPHPEEALALVAFLATEGQRLRVEVTGEPPLDASAATEFGWVDQGNTAGRQQFLEAVRTAEPAMFIPSLGEVSAPVDDAFNQIAAGDISASDALDSVAPRMQDHLDRAWETWEELGG